MLATVPSDAGRRCTFEEGSIRVGLLRRRVEVVDTL